MDVVRHVLWPSIAVALLALSPDISTADRAVYCGTTRWRPLIAQAAVWFELQERWLHAVMRAESGGCEMMNGAPTVSSAGAMGLMQLMPSTWRAYREKLQLGDDPHDPHDNILAGSAYLRDLYDRFGWPGAAAAYHAGPTRYSEHLSDARPLPRATLDYLAHIKRLTADEASYALAERTLFVVPPPPVSFSVGLADETRGDGLFIALRHGNRRRDVSEEAPADVQK